MKLLCPSAQLIDTLVGEHYQICIWEKTGSESVQPESNLARCIREEAMNRILSRHLSELEEVKLSTFYNWLDDFSSDGLFSLFIKIASTGRLSLLKYIEKTVRFPLVDRVLRINSTSCAFGSAIDRLQHKDSLHVLLYLKQTVLPCYKLNYSEDAVKRKIAHEMKYSVTAIEDYEQKYDSDCYPYEVPKFED